MDTLTAPKTDKQGFDEQYRGSQSLFASVNNKDEYVQQYSSVKLTPFYLGGHEHGYRHGTAKMLIETADALGRNRDEITVLDAGCARGELSVYLAIGLSHWS
jgi:2-polyprenyl-3-methyl-5-hydroxy-6-metoxy-1,4-benzoquinol methylase